MLFADTREYCTVQRKSRSDWLFGSRDAQYLSSKVARLTQFSQMPQCCTMLFAQSCFTQPDRNRNASLDASFVSLSSGSFSSLSSLDLLVNLNTQCSKPIDSKSKQVVLCHSNSSKAVCRMLDTASHGRLPHPPTLNLGLGRNQSQCQSQSQSQSHCDLLASLLPAVQLCQLPNVNVNNNNNNKLYARCVKSCSLCGASQFRNSTGSNSSDGDEHANQVAHDRSYVCSACRPHKTG